MTRLPPGLAATVQRLVSALALAERERTVLIDTKGRLSPGDQPVTASWLDGIATAPGRGDLVEAFAARFGRFQDRLGGKVLPALLGALGEPSGPLLDNLERAHRFGWIDDPQDWLTARALRNRLVHDYVADTIELAAALNAAGARVTMLTAAFDRMDAAAKSRGWVARAK